MMAQDVPMLETRFPVIVMKKPNLMREIRVNMALGGNTSKAFVFNHCAIEVVSSTPEETKCGGLFCDKQRIHEVINGDQGCGCYSMLTRRSNMVIDHSVRINHKDWSIYVDRFSSSQLSKINLNGIFPTTLKADTLSVHDAY